MILLDVPIGLGMALMWIFRSVHRAAMDELGNERKSIRTRLSELYQQLERGEITEEQFDEKERPLLNRLEKLKQE